MVLVSYPQSQELREQPWFEDEAYPATEYEKRITGSEAYWIPKARYNEQNQK